MPDPAIAGEFGAPFAEQLAFFRQKMGNLVPTERWDDMIGEAHDTGFMVAGAAKMGLLSDLAVAVEKALEEGRGIEDFRKDFRAIVAKNGWTGWTGEGTKQGEAWRVKTILRTNARTSYAAGRYAQLMSEDWPYWVYRHGASVEARLQHLEWNGMALEPSHDFWQKFYPPSGWGCSCYVIGARSARGIRRLGGDPDKKLRADWAKIDPKTGEPKGIAKGWGYAPGATVWRNVVVAARQVESVPADIGAAFGATVNPQVQKGWAAWLEQAKAGEVQSDALVGTLHRGDIAALVARGQEPQSAEIWFRTGLVKGAKARRHATDGDALSATSLEMLPELIANPVAVLYDERSGKLLYVLDDAAGGSASQLVIAVNYWRRDRRKKTQVNQVRSAYRQQLSEIKAALRGGRLTLIRGELK